MSDAANLTDLGLYVPRSLLESVPQAQRPAYLRAVEEFAGRKYQIAVEVAKQLPGLLADDSEPTAAERYLAGVRRPARRGRGGPFPPPPPARRRPRPG
ncbi:MAG TPA: hypothetical protein PKE32_05025 [Miltoncostaeaceae bacterium]|nr:hypothetical protein [Miltoncostaeaceae bacterium]